MAASISRLHEGPRFSNEFDMFGRATRWLRACEEQAFPVPEGIHSRMDGIEDVVRSLKTEAAPSVPSHNDLAPVQLHR